MCCLDVFFPTSVLVCYLLFNIGSWFETEKKKDQWVNLKDSKSAQLLQVCVTLTFAFLKLFFLFLIFRFCRRFCDSILLFPINQA